MKTVTIYVFPTRHNRRLKQAKDKNRDKKGRNKGQDEHLLDAPVLRRSMGMFQVPAYIVAADLSEKSDQVSSH